MVAVSGKGWKLAPSLITLYNEINLMAPNRSRRTDGTIGDTAHAARKSDHNPSGGWVTALDITHDPKGGMDAHAVARRIAASRDPRIKYIISNGQIYIPGRGWGKHTGDPHTGHAHFSVQNTPAGRDGGRSWFNAFIPQLPSAPSNPSTPIVNTSKERAMEIILRDGNNDIWLIYNDGSRKHVETAGDLEVLTQRLNVPYFDMGNDSAMYNPIVSGVWIKYTRVV